MPFYNNYLKPTSVVMPSHGGDEIDYHTYFFQDSSLSNLETIVNDFYAGLKVNGEAWPHVVDVDYQATNNGASVHHSIAITILTVGAAG